MDLKIWPPEKRVEKGLGGNREEIRVEIKLKLHKPRAGPEGPLCFALAPFGSLGNPAPSRRRPFTATHRRQGRRRAEGPAGARCGDLCASRESKSREPDAKLRPVPHQARTHHASSAASRPRPSTATPRRQGRRRRRGRPARALACTPEDMHHHGTTTWH